MQNEPILCACGCGEAVRQAKFPSQQPRFINTHQHRGKFNGNYRGGKERRACPVCGTTFREWPSQVGVTCGNRECYIQWQRLTTAARGRNKAAVKCDHCGQELRRFPSQVHTYNFCNRFCQAQHQSSLFSGVNNGRWKGGRLKYFQEQARIRDNHRCVICGFNLAIDVHHILPKLKGGTDDVSNLLTLCPNHHRLAHLGIINVTHLQRIDWQPDQTITRHALANR